MSSIGKLMKQAARMQQQMEQIQAQLAARTVEASSGGGAVKLKVNGAGKFLSLTLADFIACWNEHRNWGR